MTPRVRHRVFSIQLAGKISQFFLKEILLLLLILIIKFVCFLAKRIRREEEPHS